MGPSEPCDSILYFRRFHGPMRRSTDSPNIQCLSKYARANPRCPTIIIQYI